MGIGIKTPWTLSGTWPSRWCHFCPSVTTHRRANKILSFLFPSILYFTRAHQLCLGWEYLSVKSWQSIYKKDHNYHVINTNKGDGNKCMRGFKVRRHNIMTKYFHVCFSINWFPCLVICSDVLLGSSVQSQGSVFLGKPEKLLLHRNLSINQESPCPIDFPGASLMQKQDKFAQCCQVWGPSWLTSMAAPGPNF